MKVVRHVQMNEWMGVSILSFVHLFSVFQDGLDCTHVMLNEVCLSCHSHMYFNLISKATIVFKRS